MPLAKALAEALGCRTLSLEGFEADDVMATLTRWARSVGLGVVVCSSDKDMCQLVRDRVHVMLPRRQVGNDDNSYKKRYGRTRGIVHHCKLTVEYRFSAH